jgi:hypothetical protein
MTRARGGDQKENLFIFRKRFLPTTDEGVIGRRGGVTSSVSGGTPLIVATGEG